MLTNFCFNSSSSACQKLLKGLSQLDHGLPVTEYRRDNLGNSGRGGGTQYKRPRGGGDVLSTWVAKSASWYMNDPLCNAFGI